MKMTFLNNALRSSVAQEKSTDYSHSHINHTLTFCAKINRLPTGNRPGNTVSLQPRPGRVDSTVGMNLVDNDEPQCKICRHGTQPLNQQNLLPAKSPIKYGGETIKGNYKRLGTYPDEGD